MLQLLPVANRLGQLVVHGVSTGEVQSNSCRADIQDFGVPDVHVLLWIFLDGGVTHP